ncbi:D-glycerate dehydrogenase [Parahaliea sp. F7430]|uniref:D-glycerate dehydrogenase n=1 Tax=Sediminihaliea albiluteola TaxID=2758564 RepID=A0A7W2TX18_9GAMM|nr:D-glycerate dehydrogenase [Sediminihaliea albiluteola]MBA6413492.1 D-glycerate dehydrogenase [Sediminihaliea albiluteola]
MIKRVFVSHQMPGARIHELAELCDLNVWMGPGLLPAETLREELSTCHGLLCMLTDRLDKSLIAGMAKLEFVSSMSVGFDHIDVQALSERGIPLGNTPGVLVETTADAAFSLLLAAARRISEADRFVREGHWRSENAWSPEFFTGKDVSGATLGIIGLGAIGQAVARRAAGFGMKVLAWSRREKNIAGVEQVGLDELLLRSDFVSVHTALTEATRNLLNADRIATMKPGAVLVNTARGGIVDELALSEALRSGALYAAGIDVFEQEPVPADNPLLTLPNVVLAPHIASATTLTRARMADLAVDNLIAALKGELMPNCVNPEVY